MVLGPKLAARPGPPTVQPTVRAKLNTAQLFARTHDRTAGRPTRMLSKVLFASVAYNLHHLPKYLQLMRGGSKVTKNNCNFGRIIRLG